MFKRLKEKLLGQEILDDNYVVKDGIKYSRDLEICYGFEKPLDEKRIHFKQVKIADGCKIVNEQAFYNRTDLEKVSFPDSLEIVESEAFAGCDILREVKFNNGLKTIEDFAFAFTSIREAILPDTITWINHDAFKCCDKLTKVRLSTNLKILESGVFRRCTNLETVLNTHQLIAIKNLCFSNCNRLQHLLLSPFCEFENKKSIFFDCTHLFINTFQPKNEDLNEIFNLFKDDKTRVLVCTMSKRIFVNHSKDEALIKAYDEYVRSIENDLDCSLSKEEIRMAIEEESSDFLEDYFKGVL